MKFGFDVDMGKSVDLSTALLRRDGLTRGLKVAGLYLRGQLKEYPTQPANSSYARTGNLSKRWTSNVKYGGLTVVVGNNADYADDVQGSQRGNPYFRRVWGPNHSIKSVVRRESARVAQIVQNEITRSI